MFQIHYNINDVFIKLQLDQAAVIVLVIPAAAVSFAISFAVSLILVIQALHKSQFELWYLCFSGLLIATNLLALKAILTRRYAVVSSAVYFLLLSLAVVSFPKIYSTITTI
ncbi:MAG: hypothetical protein JKX99_03970 [Robiginitomaculum sp.]|nr:hypothetical protein [Robiginitomaculum sp.]